MKLLVLGLNYAPEKIGIAVYTTGVAEALAKAGHEVRAIAGQPYYPYWETMPGHHAWAFSHGVEHGVAVTRVPHYVPAKPTGLRRILHHASFAVAALAPALWQGLAWRPDVVLTVAPSLVAAPVARIAAFVAGADSWLHVQDIEVEAAIAAGLLKPGGRLEGLARRFEAAVLAMFGQVSAISVEMCRRLVHKGVPQDRIVELRNWAETSAIRPLSVPSPYRERWGITTPHVALYSGNIGEKQGIEIVLEAARLLGRRDDLTFVICGEGPNRARLEALAAGMGNIRFHDLQPAERLSELLGLATIHLLPQRAEAADAVLPSKLTNILASGRPVVATAAPGTGLAREVEGCGAAVAPGDPQAFAHGIEALMDDAAAWSSAAERARTRAEERWARDTVLRGFAETLDRIAAARTLASAETGVNR